MYLKYEYESSIGKLILASDEKSLVGLWLEGQNHFLGGIDGELCESGCTGVFRDAVFWLDEYFAGKFLDIRALPLDPHGTSFQQEVWEILCGIPCGGVMTYGEIARILAEKRNIPSMSSQAVGGAVGRNPISIIIPCHRVIGTDGKLTGYAGGLEKKEWLLRHEGFIK